MKKSILNLKGVQELTKTEQKMVLGKNLGEGPCPPGPCWGISQGGQCVFMCLETPKPRT